MMCTDMEVIVPALFRAGLILATIPLFSGCDGQLIAAGNVSLAFVPCVLLWVTINLEKKR